MKLLLNFLLVSVKTRSQCMFCCFQTVLSLDWCKYKCYVYDNTRNTITQRTRSQFVPKHRISKKAFELPHGAYKSACFKNNDDKNAAHISPWRRPLLNTELTAVNEQPRML